MISRYSIAALLSVFAVVLSACATAPIAAPSQIEAHPSAVTVPYRISAAGLLVIDVAVNGFPARPFVIDSGANVTAIYEDHAQDLGLVTSGKTATVNGLVSSSVRPLADAVEIQIGPKIFQRDRAIILETPPDKSSVDGILGVDALRGYTVLFNKTAERPADGTASGPVGPGDGKASFIPSAELDGDSFSGWHKVRLRNHVGSFPDNGLYFATILLTGHRVPVLIDTGSELNFVNWELAALDEEIAKIHKKLRKAIRLQGAIDTIPLRTKAVFFDVQLGGQQWPEVDVVILDFDSLNAVAPVDRPMMLAGAGLFTLSTFAFDFAGNMIYIKPDTAEPE